MAEQYRPQDGQTSPEQFLQVGNEFLQHFGVEINPTEQPEQFLQAMAQLDPRYQGDRELVRWQLEADQTKWDDETKDVIMRTAEGMHMLKPETPLVGNYDVVIALGGARQANLDRARYAVKGRNEGNTNFKHLVVAGSSRILNEAEKENASNYAPGATTEFDLCVGAAATVAKENPGLVASVLYVDEMRAGTPVVIEKVLAAMGANGSLGLNTKVAAITTQIYQTSTELDLDRVAKQFGITDTFTAGNPSDPNVVAKRTPATYMSEVLRTLKAAVNGAQAEKEYAAKELEAVRQRVALATRETETVINEHTDGGRAVRDIEGNEYVIEPDGSRWVSFSATSGISYMGPDDLAGYYAY